MKQMTIVNVTRRSKYIYLDLEKDGYDLSPRQPSRHDGGLVCCEFN